MGVGETLNRFADFGREGYGGLRRGRDEKGERLRETPREDREGEGSARLGYLSRGARVPSYATVSVTTGRMRCGLTISSTANLAR